MKRRVFLQASLGTAALWPARFVLAGEAPLADLNAKTLTGAGATLRGAEVRELAEAMRGQVLVPGQSGYDQARRIWNGMFDRKPAFIARCAAPSDVMHAVNFARQHQLLTAVRCGGHSASGKSTCDGGLMIDLSPMQSVRVDPKARTARVEGGALLGHLDRETKAFGLVTTAGTVSHTGVGGLTLGGGFGRVCRRFGLACDNVRSVDIVTADGKLLVASATENPELFWGVRGGGGNFGVVTSFEFDLHAMDPTILGGPVAWPLAQAGDVLRYYAEFAQTMPDELNLDPALVMGPDKQPVLLIEACWSADKAAGERALKPLRAFGKPLFDQIGALPYVALQMSGDERNAPGQRFYEKSGFFVRFEPKHIDLLIEGFKQTAPHGAFLALQGGGGAVGRKPMDATSFPNRRAKQWVMMAAVWQDPARDQEIMSAIRAAWKEIEPHTDGFYVNSYSDDVSKQLASNYGTNYPRLVALKKKYDPANLFRLNANILPA
jgi:hypothetical protein